MIGKSKAYLKHIPKIADVLNVSEDYFLLENLILSLTSDQQELVDLYLKLNENQKLELIKHARIIINQIPINFKKYFFYF